MKEIDIDASEKAQEYLLKPLYDLKSPANTGACRMNINNN